MGNGQLGALDVLFSSEMDDIVVICSHLRQPVDDEFVVFPGRQAHLGKRKLPLDAHHASSTKRAGDNKAKQIPQSMITGLIELG